MKLKKSISILIACIMGVQVSAFADVLGTVTGGWQTDMGAGTVLTNTVYESEQKGVGKQTEYYYEYTPNEEAVPTVVNGAALYGKRNIKEAAKYMEDNGMRPLLGINADYFSFKTGIPMGHTIIDGEIVSKDFTGQNGIGFRSDGSAFISWLEIGTTITKEDGSASVVDCINRWCQEGSDAVYILSDMFGDTTKTSQTCYFAIMSPVEGKMQMGGTMKLKVDEFFEYTGEIDIPDGKYVLVADKENCEWFKKEFVKSLKVGDVVSVYNESVYDKELWNSAAQGLSSVGGRLVENGQVYTEFEAGSAPRTAVGVKEDGNIIFYVIDGRQQGYSYGVQLKTLAQRMKELGCVDAINLDGGGSTSMGGIFPGSASFDLLNRPSDGSMRKCANFLFLKDKRQPTGIPQLMTTNEISNTNFLAGAVQQVYVTEAWDTSNYKMENPQYQYRLDTQTQSTVDAFGNVTFAGTGKVDVVMQFDGDVSKVVTLDSYETPDEIKVTANGQSIDYISVQKGDSFTVDLNAQSYVNGVNLVGNDSCYIWGVNGDIGTVSPDGIFTAASDAVKTGSITVTAGNRTKEIKVSVSSGNNPFADTSGHWAESYLTELAMDGTIKGVAQNGTLYYFPDQVMTRAEFASLISNYWGVDVLAYQDKPLIFVDKEQFAPWMENYAKAMYDMGIIQGRESERGVEFAPNDQITRAEAMTIMGRLMEQDAPQSALDFTDTAQIPQWAAEYMGKLLYAGVVNGYEDGSILPNQSVKRSEAAVMIYKFKSVS